MKHYFRIVSISVEHKPAIFSLTFSIHAQYHQGKFTTSNTMEALPQKLNSQKIDDEKPWVTPYSPTTSSTVIKTQSTSPINFIVLIVCFIRFIIFINRYKKC